MFTTRQKIQFLFLSITIFSGIKFYYYITHLQNNHMDIIKPGTVEGFLPISALMALKRFLFTGQYDSIHPAGLTIFIAAILISIVINKSFCSHICPVGTVSELISAISQKIRIHKYLYYPIVSLKYLLLAFFANIILLNLDIYSIERFLNADYNKVADAKMLYFFLNPSTTTIIVMASLLLLTLIFNNFWCRFLCPYGALLGIVAVISPFKIKRSITHCTNCKKCSSVCPMSIDVHQKKTIRSPDCMGCFECVHHKTNKECLMITHTTLPPSRLSAIVLVLFFAIIAIAILTNHWVSTVPNIEYKNLLDNIHQLSH